MKTKDWIEFISTQLLMLAFIIGFFVILSMMITAGRWEAVNNMVMSLLTIVVMIASYKWGSSAGSAKKTDIISKLPSLPPDDSDVKSIKVETTETKIDSPNTDN